MSLAHAVTPALVSTRHEYYRLFGVYLPIGIGVFAVILLATVMAVLIYRRRPPERAARWYENNRLEGTYAALLACVAAFLLYLTFSGEHRVDTVASRETPALTINVVASKWEWSFYYPGYGIVHRSGTVGRQPLVVPANEAVRFNLSSLDVIHAFWVPEVLYKHDLFPDNVQVATLTFSRTGSFQGQCAEFCGLRHADMVFDVDVLSPGQFATWAHRAGRTL